MTFPASMTVAAFDKQLSHAKACLVKESLKPEPHWYPCGFAWLNIKIRKNGALAKILLAHDFRWSDYEKCYQYRIPAFMYAEGMSQSMDYAARCLNAMAWNLKDSGIPCTVTTRLD